MLIRLESVCPWPVSLEASVGKAVLFFFFLKSTPVEKRGPRAWGKDGRTN